MSTAFIDSSLQKKGYVLLPGLLSRVDVTALLKLYVRFEDQYSGPFHTTHFSTDKTYKREVHNAITDIVFPLAAGYLSDFKPLFGNFMIKNPDPSVAMFMHADWAYVDEERFRSVAIWIPLIDVDETNGCLGIIEGSHKVTNPIRGPQIRQSSQQHELEWERRYGRLLPMKAGDAIIYDHGLLHYSHPNKTDKPRPALNFSLAPSAATPLLHYCGFEGSDQIDMYSVSDPDFYIHYTHFQHPETGQLLKKIPVSTVKYIDDRMNNFRKQSALDKIKSWF
jgi:hypothetical protein